MSIINAVLTWFLKKRMAQIDHFRRHPHEVQEKLLLQLINEAKNTEWGKKFDYKSIRSYQDFRERVSVQPYESLKPWVDRLIRGEQNLLWPSAIKWYAKSSGTTSDKSKFIPLSNESLEDCHYKAGKDVLSIYCHNRPDTMIFSGKGLIMGGSHKVSEFNSNAYFGDLSAILLQNYPFWGEFLRTPDLSLALIDDWEEKLDRIARATIQQDVTSISGVPSWNLILLKKILELTGRHSISEVWPNLELFIHGGISFVPYRKQFNEIIDAAAMQYMETYNASEGFFGIQDDPSRDDMLLMLDYGIFYEFIPLDLFGTENQQAISLSEVQTGVNYAMVISTNGGLWRYIIGDTVRFTSLTPYRILISGRTKNFINAFGEEVIVDNTDKALDQACQQSGAIISEYTAAPVYLGNKQSASHQYLIEFEKEPENLAEFARLLDQALKERNSDYEAKRSGDLMLKLPLIVSLPRGSFFNWLKSKGKIGGQHKVPRLSNDRRYVDEILQWADKQEISQ